MERESGKGEKEGCGKKPENESRVVMEGVQAAAASGRQTVPDSVN